MKIKDIVAPLEEFAPLSSQEPYDNAGLIVGSPYDEATAALICVDVTEEVLDEAIEKGANLIIAHHPVIFHPIKQLGGDDNVSRVISKAIKNDVAIYACHTNLDRAHNGMSHLLAQKLGLRNIAVLDPDEPQKETTTEPKTETGIETTTRQKMQTGFGAVGEFPEPVETLDFLRSVAKTLAIETIRHSRPPRETIRRVAIVTGSGGDGLEKAIEAGADVFLTGDVRHDRFVAAQNRILLADIGHWESEFCAIELMHSVLSKKIANFAVHKSASSKNPVRYLSPQLPR
ncbi:MAG: Nif3-like dinuclear metal center hexameric protein [Alistipes sp.]|nr:Nif3-like dinuclear metal center hexameric protein [Alistipes sp.]